MDTRTDTPGTGTPRKRARALVGAVALIATLGLSGCSLLHHDDTPLPKPTSAAQPDGGTGDDADGTDDADGAKQVAESTPTPAPQLAPTGTVVAETDVVSRSGDTAIHVKVVAGDDSSFRVQLSGYRTTVSQPMSIEFRQGVPKPGDGWDPHTVGTRQWDADAPPPADYPLSSPSIDPTYLHSVVLVPLATDLEDPPSWTGHVLAVAPLTWHMRQQFTDVHITVGKAVPGAYGNVYETDGRPTSYLVAHGDEERTVAKRFGITVAELEWLNPISTRSSGWLYEGTTINISPAER